MTMRLGREVIDRAHPTDDEVSYGSAIAGGYATDCQTRSVIRLPTI